MGKESRTKRVRRMARIGEALQLEPTRENERIVKRIERDVRGQRLSYDTIKRLWEALKREM